VTHCHLCLAVDRRTDGSEAQEASGTGARDAPLFLAVSTDGRTDGSEAQEASGTGARDAPLFLGSIVTRRFKYSWLILALFGFSGMAVIVALSVIYSNQ